MPVAGLFRAVALLGMLWAFLLAALILAVQDSWIQGAGSALVLLIVMLTVFARLYCLRRWAAVVVFLYCGYTALTAPTAGIWQWVVGWSMVTLGFGFQTARGWSTLRNGA